ncbi:MAG: thioesterase family protein [Deferrisomatales bacterium]
MAVDPPYRRKVRFSDTDRQGHVFHANYFVYFDDALTDFLEAVGWPYEEIVHRGYDLVLARAECDFLSPGAFGEVLATRVGVERVGTTSVVFSFEVTEEAGGRAVAGGREVYVVLDRDTKRPTPVPDFLREAFAREAAGG